jgi:hypothetical protein
MTGQSEFSSRAELCRRLAQRDPANRTLWMAEAETWTRRSKDIPDGEERATVDSGILARLLEQST